MIEIEGKFNKVLESAGQADLMIECWVPAQVSNTYFVNAIKSLNSFKVTFTSA